MSNEDEAELVMLLERFIAAQKPLEPEFAEILYRHYNELVYKPASEDV